MDGSYIDFVVGNRELRLWSSVFAYRRISVQFNRRSFGGQLSSNLSRLLVGLQGRERDDASFLFKKVSYGFCSFR